MKEELSLLMFYRGWMGDDGVQVGVGEVGKEEASEEGLEEEGEV